MEYLSLFLSSFLAATFLPFSSEAVLGGLVLAQKPWFILLILATIGNTLGGMFNFIIGYYGKLAWASKFLKIKEEKVLEFQQKIEKYNSLLALFCWLPVVGDPLALALGYFKVDWKKTVFFMAIGKGARYGLLIYSLMTLY